jgi:serine O-acetyltransferase
LRDVVVTLDCLPDLSREQKTVFSWAPSRSLLHAVRAWNVAIARNSMYGRILSKSAVMRHRFWSVVTGADIPVNSQLGLGLLMPHPNGVVIHPAAQIGMNCLIMQQVTIGANEHGDVPKVGNHVDIGAGAKIIGGVVIGDHALIGANAVVVKDVAPWHVAVGVPAVARKRKDAPF